ncbi:hypothetical protein [Microtetraspora malaysiensis]|uniref:hypothetical protein n=1 Tax=Microtetraspora malaysiensis TaxID=161358 RepID=UPI003D8D385D
MNGTGSEWSGDMLDRPEMVEAFATQLRRVLSDQAEWLARIRRDAEAMWKANPPAEYGSFEAWWRHQRTAGPFGEIQRHIEAASRLTFALEARHRRNRHEIPAARQAAAEARQAPALPRNAAGQPRSVAREAAAQPREDFLTLISNPADRQRRGA